MRSNGSGFLDVPSTAVPIRQARGAITASLDPARSGFTVGLQHLMSLSAESPAPGGQPLGCRSAAGEPAPDKLGDVRAVQSATLKRSTATPLTAAANARSAFLAPVVILHHAGVGHAVLTARGRRSPSAPVDTVLAQAPDCSRAPIDVCGRAQRCPNLGVRSAQYGRRPDQ